MMTKIFAKGALTTCVVAGLIAGSYGCDEPAPKCAAGRGEFTVKLTPAAGSSASCAKVTSDAFVISTYNATGPEQQKPNLDIASIAIQSAAMSSTVDNATAAGSTDPDATHKEYGLGFFSTATPVNDFCVVPTLTAAIQNIPAIAADPANMVDAAPATSITYQWSNVRIYVTAIHLGGQMTGDLTITTDGVACQYTATGLYPNVPCGIADPTDPTGSKMIPDDLDGVEKACDPFPAPDAVPPRSTGSMINPDYPVKCDPDLLTCFITKPVPALN